MRTTHLCLDCGIDTWDAKEMYMVSNFIWRLAHNPFYAKARGYESDVSGMLCIGCLEKRLRRKLIPEDFIDVPLNDGEEGTKSERLLERLGYVQTAA